MKNKKFKKFLSKINFDKLREKIKKAIEESNKVIEDRKESCKVTNNKLQKKINI